MDNRRPSGGGQREESRTTRSTVQQEERTASTVVNKKGSIYLQNRFFFRLNGWLGHYYTNFLLLFKDCLGTAGGVRGVDSEEDIRVGYFLM